MSKNMERINITIDVETLTLLKQLSALTGAPVSAIIRQQIDEKQIQNTIKVLKNHFTNKARKPLRRAAK